MSSTFSGYTEKTWSTCVVSSQFEKSVLETFSVEFSASRSFNRTALIDTVVVDVVVVAGVVDRGVDVVSSANKVYDQKFTH